MLSLEVRKRAGGAEVHRVDTDALTLGASSGNEVVVRARGVAGRHIRLVEKNGRYHLDLFKGVDAVSLNGREFTGGDVTPGDRITIGEATITILGIRPPLRATPVHEIPITDTATAAPVPPPTTEVEYRSMRLAAYRICREVSSREDLATRLIDFLDSELEPTEWASGEISRSAGFRPLASTFLERPALPPRMLEDYWVGERVMRSETVTGVLTLIAEPARDAGDSFGILVRETPRLPARAVLMLEEIAFLAGIAMAKADATAGAPPAPAPREAPPAPQGAALSGAENVLRETDDLKKIIETVEHEVINRTMRRAEGNQSRASEVLNISRGSLIAKLKEYQIPDYRYLRRERSKRN